MDPYPQAPTPSGTTRAEDPADLGDRLHRALAGRPLPMLLVQTTFSLLRGTATPAQWGQALGALQPGRTGPWAVLADQDDLAGLPATVEAWGRSQVGVGANLSWGTAEAVLLAPEVQGYGRLCRLLSRSHDGVGRWPPAPGETLDLDGIIALVQDQELGTRLTAAGAEVYWRSDLRPRPAPVGMVAVAAPVLRHLDGQGAQAEPVLEAIATRGTVAVGSRPPWSLRRDGIRLDQLPALDRAYRGHEDQLERAQVLLDRCRYVPGAPGPDGGPPLHLPPAPEGDAGSRLRALAEAGARVRYGDPFSDTVRMRLDHELAVIIAKGFAGYILTVHVIATGRRTCGRGSAASSLVVYCLGLTNVDPIRYRLLFERFLAPERIDPPDIDIDFPWDERDAVLAAVLTRFGRDHVAMVATHQTLGRWAALREAARAHGLPDAMTGSMRRQLSMARRYGTPIDLPDPWPVVLSAARAIAGHPRHVGLHCGGVVVTPEPVCELVPIHPAAKTLDGVHVPAMAWEKDGAEAMGLVKIDLLGNRSLAVIRDACADLAEDGIAIDEATWRPQDDQATRDLVASGRTMGCFYIESPAMRQLQAKVGSGEFDRLVVHSSIIRPAAMHWIDTYCRRYHEFRATGRHDPAWYPHPCLLGLLSESFGVLSYQEDVMMVAQELAGFDSAGANRLRKALGRSDTRERLQRFASDFHVGAAQRGVDPGVAIQVWDMIQSFAGYSFCKAHSASYAAVSFQCAYLKAHHPAHFLARVIANQGGFYRPGAYVEEARRLGITIHGPCVLHSFWETRREGPRGLRIGLQLVPGLGKDAARRLIQGRSGPRFQGIRDLQERCRLTGQDLAHLDDADALEGVLPGDPGRRAWVVAAAVGCRPSPGVVVGQQQLFLSPGQDDPPPPDLPGLTPRQRSWRTLATLGFLPRAHALTLYDLPRRQHGCRDLDQIRPGQRITLIGLVLTRKQVDATYEADPDRGQPERVEAMSFVTLEDETGVAELVFFPESYRRYGPCLEQSGPISVSGTVHSEFGCSSLHVAWAAQLGR